jgi:hypothetical protein
LARDRSSGYSWMPLTENDLRRPTGRSSERAKFQFAVDSDHSEFAIRANAVRRKLPELPGFQRPKCPTDGKSFSRNGKAELRTRRSLVTLPNLYWSEKESNFLPSRNVVSDAPGRPGSLSHPRLMWFRIRRNRRHSQGSFQGREKMPDPYTGVSTNASRCRSSWCGAMQCQNQR